YFAFAQDQWRIRPNFTLTYGVRYESPGNPIANLVNVSQRIYKLNNNDARFLLQPQPSRDTNNWAPRVGFNYRFGDGKGLLHWLTGHRKLVMRGGYLRTYNTAFNNIALNVTSSLPPLFAYTVLVDPAT